jgi:hypothetical protein
MPKVQETTIKMKNKAPKKGSVLFESSESDPILSAIYLMRQGMEKNLGIKNLDDVKEIEVTVKVL